MSSSATFFPSANVLIITPNPCGFILLISCFNRFCSFGFSIFCEIDILSEKGINIIYLPAIEISVVNLGPLVEIGSFEICVKISSPVLRASLIPPSLFRFGSFLKFFNDAVLSFFSIAFLVNFL